MKIYDYVANQEFSLMEEKENGFYTDCPSNKNRSFTKHLYLLFHDYFDPDFGQCDFRFTGLTDKEIIGMTKRLEKKI